MTILVTVTFCLVPVEVLAYNEAMAEIVICSDPGVIVQNQSYSTSTRQTLFHTASNAATDTEAFAFDGTPQAGINLAQTSAATAAGTETGFFTSSASSDIVPPVHIGGGFLGTWIGDPLRTGLPIYAGLSLPYMTQTDPGALASQPRGLAPAVSEAAEKAIAAKDSTAGNRMQKDAAAFEPVINYDLNDALAGAPAGASARNATAAVEAGRQNVSAPNATGKPAAAIPKPSPSPSPAPARSPIIPPGQVFYHQQNKPFSTALTAPYGPYKSTPEKIQNTSGFDRFLMNTVGRSTTDRAFNGTTSSPAYITPGKALAVQIPYDFIQGARGMTMPGTRLNYRAWPL